MHNTFKMLMTFTAADFLLHHTCLILKGSWIGVILCPWKIIVCTKSKTLKSKIIERTEICSIQNSGESRIGSFPVKFILFMASDIHRFIEQCCSYYDMTRNNLWKRCIKFLAFPKWLSQRDWKRFIIRGRTLSSNGALQLFPNFWIHKSFFVFWWMNRK